MKNAPQARSRPFVWPLLILAALFLYIVTWPPVEILFIKAEIPSRFRHHPSAVKLASISSNSSPISFLYRPLHLWCCCNNWNNPLQRYWDWWQSRLA